MIQQMFPALLLALLLTGCADMPDNNVDPATVTELASCPSSPNCVCSIDTGRSHYIDPLAVTGELDAAWQTLRDILAADGSISIVAADDHYIRAEAKTRLLRFTDDVEFLLNRAAGVIDMRSASRLGYSDLGKNRSRLEGVRSAMRDAGAL
ncbi:MAG: DUF1499 domain-containing protein [Woeseiaceae bacterium]